MVDIIKNTTEMNTKKKKQDMVKLGSKGGKAVLRKYGNSHFQELAKRKHEKQREEAEA